MSPLVYKFLSHRSLFKLNAIQLELDLGFISHLLAQCQVNQHLLLGIRGIFCAEKSGSVFFISISCLGSVHSLKPGLTNITKTGGCEISRSRCLHKSRIRYQQNISRRKIFNPIDVL